MGLPPEAENVASCPERQTNQDSLASEADGMPLPEALHGEMMAGIDAVISKRADSLWQRGREEVGKLRQQSTAITGHITELYARQEALLAEHAAVRDALVDISAKLELVTAEMISTVRISTSGHQHPLGCEDMPMPRTLFLPPLAPPTNSVPCRGSSQPKKTEPPRSPIPSSYRPLPAATEADHIGFGERSNPIDCSNPYSSTPGSSSSNASAVKLSLASALDAAASETKLHDSNGRTPKNGNVGKTVTIDIAECLDFGGNRLRPEAPSFVPGNGSSIKESNSVTECTANDLDAVQATAVDARLRPEAPEFVPGVSGGAPNTQSDVNATDVVRTIKLVNAI